MADEWGNKQSETSNTKQTAELLGKWTDNFDHQTTHQDTGLIDVPGEHDFTPERLRYHKDGTRRFLQYGDDSNYSETDTGHLLEPDSDQTLTLKSAERISYPVSLDILPNMARRITQPLQEGDVVGGGYGDIDLANFDPSNITYSGTDADGYFWYHTVDTGLSSAVFAEVQSGTVVYDTTEPLPKDADILTLLQGEVNWYAVGPARWTNSFTDIENHPKDPQRNEFVAAVANDDGAGPTTGSHRLSFSVHQASGNSGLGLEVGSIGVRTSGIPDYESKVKGFSMDLEYTNPAETYQALAALRVDPNRREIKTRLPNIEIIRTPGTEANRTRVLLIAADPVETNAGDIGGWSTPVEHSPANSVIEEIEVAGDASTPLTGPVQDHANTDVSGPETANSMNNPGGYQLGRDSVTPEEAGNEPAFSTTQVSNRELYDSDICLILGDSSTAGTIEIDVITEQGS